MVTWLVITASVGTEPRTQEWHVTGGDVRVICPLTVGGSFEARTSALAGAVSSDPSATVLAGELSVDLKTLDAGLALRTQHMRDEYLEVGRGEGFEKAILSNIDIGPVGVNDGQRPFAARLRLHGVTHPVAGKATLTHRGSSLRVETSFPLRIADYGITDPTYLGVGVKNEITVKVTFNATSSS